jgi:GTP cyclohydrolase I
MTTQQNDKKSSLFLDEATNKYAAVTRFPSPIAPNSLNDDEKIEVIADHFRQIMEILGLDLTDDSLANTPYRVARMYVKEVFSGLDFNQFPQISFIKDEFHHEHKSHIVLVKVGFTSFCEHHFVPMNGTAYVAYLPNKKLIGLSKIPRIVRFFARRPQVQERLTAQIADSLSIVLNTEDVAVSITAKHFCVIARGIEDENGHTITNVLRGKFDTSEELRKEFFAGISR